MKRTKRIFSMIASMSLLTCAVIMPMTANAECYVSDNARAELTEDNKSATAIVSYYYDPQIAQQVNNDAYKKADDLTQKHFDDIDTSELSDLELTDQKSDYHTTLYVELCAEMNDTKKKELAKPILEDLGVTADDNVEYPSYGLFKCILNAHQLAVAENNDQIFRITVDTDWSKDGYYIGTPSLEPDATASDVSESQELLDEFKTEKFSDQIVALGDNTISFKEHGIFRYELNEIENTLKKYKLGDEIMIEFETIKLHNNDIPRINSITMISLSKLELGDPTGDLKIDSSDASFVLGEYSILSTGGASHLTTVEKTAADANKDGQINSKDASLMLGMYSYNSTSKNKIKTMEDYMEYCKTH